MKSVSIVIINHNYGAFLAAAINSALAQTVVSKDIVVVDDGSTDNSRSIIQEFGDKIVPVFKVAGGHVSAVNAGYEVGGGEICIFLDADDILYPGCVETVMANWQEDDVKLQYRLDTIDHHGVDQRMPFPHFPADLTPQSVRRQALRFGVYPWTVSSGNAFSRKFLEALLPIDPVEIYRSPDGYLSKMAPLFGDVRSIPDILGAYRVHGGNVWAQAPGELRIAPIVRWLKFHKVLQVKFEAKAAELKIPIARDDHVATLQEMEYRLLAFRFGQAEYPQPETTARRLFRRGIAAAMASPNTSLVGRAAWIGWLFVIAFGPKATVQRIFGLARSQSGRSWISRQLVRISRGRSSMLG